VEFRHEENSRYFSHSGEGGIAFIGKILHDPGQVNSHILMDDYYTYFNDTVNKQVFSNLIKQKIASKISCISLVSLLIVKSLLCTLCHPAILNAPSFISTTNRT
jgi:hypothetical protein